MYAKKSLRPGLKNRQKRGSDSSEISKVSKSVDCEIGTISVSVDKKSVSCMKPKQRLQSGCFREKYMGLVERLSYRSAASFLNRLLHRENDNRIKVSTLEDRVESQGCSLSESYMLKAEDILRKNGIEAQEGVITADSHVPASVLHPALPELLDENASRKLVADYNREIDKDRKLKYEEDYFRIEPSSDRCCYISIDDIGVRFQKERRKGKYKKDRKFIENTVIHIQADDLQYTITSIGMKDAFRLLVAFLLENGLMERYRLVFFTDGAVCIRDYIEKYFGFRQHTIILDWLHLKKKCNEILSQAIKGTKDEKKEIKRGLMAILWTARIDKAIKFIDGIKKCNIKNPNLLEYIKGYIDRKSPNITCYAMRHKLGLRVSSNRGEKANDIVVASRQKHNGMSWSNKGSGALAIITTARVNGELQHWLETGSVLFKMTA